MGLHRFHPTPSGRMGTLWTLSSVRNAALVEFGSMGHMLYGRANLKRMGKGPDCKLYSTHIAETDIAMGGTERLSRAIADIAARDQPRVIFVLPSTVPEMIGTDLHALCKELQPEYPQIRLLPFGAGGFNIELHHGVQEALLLLAKTLPQDVPPTSQLTFNLIGSCTDLFQFNADAQEIVRIMEGALGTKPLCIMTSGTSVEDMERMGGAHMNLVIRREGLPAAAHLQQRFGTPWVEGRPYGMQGTYSWLEQIANVLDRPINQNFLSTQYDEAQPIMEIAPRFFSHQKEAVKLSMGGHADVVKGILAYASGELGLTRALCWCDSAAMATKDVPHWSEGQWSQAVTSKHQGLLMASGEVLAWAGHHMTMQIANPCRGWQSYPYSPPYMGFRGAMNLASMWMNEVMRAL